MVGLSADLPNGKREWDDLAIGEVLILREGWIALTVSPTAKSVTSLRTASTILSRGLNAIRLMYLCWAGPNAPSRRDDATTVFEEEQHLRVPVIGRQRPAVAEHDGLALAPVLVKDLDVVFGRDGRHALSSLRRERAAGTMDR